MRAVRRGLLEGRWTMFVRSVIVCAFVFASGAAPAVAWSADLAFAKVAHQIVSFPVGDPTNATPVGPLADSLSGMDFDPGTNVLWAINSTTPSVGTINQSTGAYTSVTMLQGGITAFTIDPVGGSFYVAKGDRDVYSLDPVSGQATLLGSGAEAGVAFASLSSYCGGRLFSLAGNGTDLP